MEANNLKWGIKDANKVPKDYMLTILATVNPKHAIFHPSYYPTKMPENPQTVEVNQDFGIEMRFKSKKLTLALKDKKICDFQRP